MRVKLEDITKRYRHITAVNHLNLEIKSGEFLVMLGSSGSGKSTTLNMLAGLETPTKGQILFNERLVNNVPAGKRDIALVFQNYALYPHMKVFDNIAFPLRIRKENERDIYQKVVGIAEMLSIHPYLQNYPRELSGGERQRVALARALVRNPRLFLMDEPLSNLDARLRLSARGELKKLQKTRNITTIYVTHDQVEALTLGDRIAIMDKGNLQQVGTPEEIYRNPQNIFVAGFMGTPPMNIVEVRISSMRSFILGETTFEFPGPLPQTTKATLGIRPEELQILPANTHSAIPGIIEHIEFLGHESIIHVRIAPTATIWYVKEVVKGIRTGDSICLKFRPENVYWFDTITGKRI